MVMTPSDIEKRVAEIDSEILALSEERLSLVGQTISDSDDGYLSRLCDSVQHLDAFPRASRVAVQGIPGAYSEIACKTAFKQPDISYLPTWEQVCDAVDEGAVEYGILPLENSTAGTVDRVYDLLVKRDLFVVGSVKLGIHHDLLVKPGTKITDIKTVYSHEQALRQCEHFLGELGPQVNASILANTAMAARAVAESPSIEVAAISSSNCAELYGLNVIRSSVQDQKVNFTRFVVVSKRLLVTSQADRSSVVLILPHQAGSLYNAMVRFASNGINMLKLESRPIPGSAFEFMFYIDFEGTLEDAPVRRLLAHLIAESDQCKLLGSYGEVEG